MLDSIYTLTAANFVLQQEVVTTTSAATKGNPMDNLDWLLSRLQAARTFAKPSERDYRVERDRDAIVVLHPAYGELHFVERNSTTVADLERKIRNLSSELDRLSRRT